MLRSGNFILILLIICTAATAQPISQIRIGVNGLTCSVCTRSVEMSLLRLDFVDSVSMNLENTDGEIYTQSLIPPDFNKIARAITDAGFSVRFLKATLALNESQISESGCFTVNGINFQWIGYNKSNKNIRFTFVDSPFLPSKEYSKWKNKIQTNSCSAGKSAFHVVNAD